LTDASSKFYKKRLLVNNKSVKWVTTSEYE